MSAPNAQATLNSQVQDRTGGMTTGKTEFVAEPGKQEVFMIRVLDAPRELVFKVLTDPKLIPQWWGPRSLTTTVEKMDVRHGGVWRYIQRDADGNEYAFRGVYHEVTAPERLVYTFEFEGTPGHVILETMTLEEMNGKTKLTDQGVFQSVADRDGMAQAGAESGGREMMDRLEELLAQIKKSKV